MVQLAKLLLLNCREQFKFPDKSMLKWFPGHMGKGLKQMQQKLKSVDCIVEVHDARIPISGRNKHFKQSVSGLRPHILLYNKNDLADLRHQDIIVNNLKNEGISNVLFSNAKDSDCNGIKKLVPTAKDIIANSDRYNRSENRDYCIMIIGVPNVGKSSVINALRHKYLKKTRATPVGAVAGVTRSVMSKIKVCHEPLMYILDTPGILEPQVSDIHAAFKLALCSSMQDHLVGLTNIADYLLFWLNKNKNFTYVEYLGLKEPSDNIIEVLLLAAVNMNKTIKRKSTDGGYVIQPDSEYAASYFIKGFRTGLLGKVMLDENFI